MYRIAILGCENSHANTFLNYVIGTKEIEKTYTDIEVVGVYSEDRASAEKLRETYGVNVMERYDEFVGKVDGIIVTARHGDNHYKYAKPYLDSGIPMFIDKPITVSEEDALELRDALIKNKIKVSGGSVCKYPKLIQELRSVVKEENCGKVYGGMLRAPVNMDNPYGGFFFYSQHLVQAMCTVFGYYPKSVKAFVNGEVITCIVRYASYDVTLVFTVENYEYAAGINCEKLVRYESYPLDGCFEKEFAAFYNVLTGGEPEESYDDFIAPVFILNAIDRSIKSGNEEPVHKFN
jgi:hypothetical protein